ncbi:MAG: AEC family transporter [Alphaproteobacteria bacterium]
MIPVAAALAPVFALIVIGFGLRRTGFLGPSFWEQADLLTYYVLFPSLLLHSLATAALTGLNPGGMALALAVATLLVAAVLIFARRGLALEGPSFTSVFQGAIRPNTYIGLAAAGALFGADGLALAAVAVAATVPLVNVLSVIALAVYANGRETGAASALRIGRDVVLAVARNPLVLACLAGILLNWRGVGVPYAGPVIEVLGRAALPMGLLSVGAGLDGTGLRGSVIPMSVSAGAKLILLPLLAALLVAVTGTGGLAAAVTVLFAALPTSATSYVMARRMGGDHGLMAGIITCEIILAAAAIPAALTLLGPAPP